MDADDPEAVLATLDPDQREVVLASRGPVCVLAGAGTGKTRSIAHRIAYGVRTGAVDPAHVLAVTFTTRAAGELRGRLHQLAGSAGGLERVQARTFHAAALRQLSHFWPRTIGGRPPAVLASKLGLLSEAASRAGVRAGQEELRDAAAEIEWAKAIQVRPDGYPAAAAAAGRTAPLDAAVIGRLFGGYEQLRRERHLVDFESVLELTAAILAGYRLAAAEVADRYRYFVVDEYQDVNPLQKLLLDAWTAGRDEVCVVGDPQQSIYSFTGASPGYLTGFLAEFPHATVVRLVRNYRSTPQVIALANRLSGGIPAVSLPGHDGGPVLLAQQPAGPEPEFACHADESAEATAIAARAARLMAEGVPPREMAVLVRTNAQTARFERAFAEVGVPCQVRGAERFFARPEVRQAMGLLRASLISTQAADGPPVVEVRHILTGLGLTAEPPPGLGAARERWESLAALAQLAEDLCLSLPGAGMTQVVTELTRRAAIEHAPALDGVTVASLHAAKGLEWDVVFLPGLNEGNLPIVHAQSEAALAEERRLFYVGVTRARRQLCLSWLHPRSAGGRSPGGRSAGQPSRFLDGLRPTGRQPAWQGKVPRQGRGIRGSQMRAGSR